MPSAIDLLNRAQRFIEAAFGPVSFTIAGIDGTFTGTLDQYAADKSLLKKGGGYEGEYDSQIVAMLAQFSAVEGELERALLKKRLTVEGRVFRIDKTTLDTNSITLLLANPNRSE